MMPCSLAYITDHSVDCATSIITLGDEVEDGGSAFLWNTFHFLPDYMMSLWKSVIPVVCENWKGYVVKHNYVN